jgi:hypothetical protein
MATRKVTTSYVEVYKVKGETMKIAFNNLKQEKGLDHHHLDIEESTTLDQKNISNGEIYKNSKKLYGQYVNNTLSEYTVKGALYNLKPNLKDETRIVMHNIVIKGTKQWETVNSYRTDTGEVLTEDVGTKEAALVAARELAIERNKTINVVVSKRLVGMDGILAVAEFIPIECTDDSNIYVFWVFTTKVVDADEDELAEEHTEVDSVGQLSIKEDLFSYVGRSIVN